MLRIAAWLIPLLLPLLAQAGIDELPDIGSSAGAIISPAEEYQLGRMIMRGLRDSDLVLDDPEVTEYVQAIGNNLASHAGIDGQSFQFFVVRDDGINAFALPGGFIGINMGLILETRSESELGGVLAHEIAHVTQKHIARQIEAASNFGLVSAAATLAAVLVGVAVGSADVIQAGVAAGQSASIQSRINFTRAHEYEADRVGIGILADAGYDPSGMVSFFELMAQRARLSPSWLPELLRTHPVSSARITEARNRAKNRPTAEQTISHRGYRLARARLVVLSAKTPAEALEHFRREADGREAEASEVTRYGLALAYAHSGEYGPASEIFRSLRASNEEVTEYHIGLAQTLLWARRDNEALEVYAEGHRLFPRNVSLTVRYAQALIQTGQPGPAHDLMLDLLNNINPSPTQVRLLAMAASASGNTGDSHYYMSEVHLLNGELQLALDQLRLALYTPEITAIQRERYDARMREIREALDEQKKKRKRKPSDSENFSG
ncbi:MAG: M48 family metallopeptidase [Gammaproteobacteria bacterium]|nr:M48 family metallopeptidase [Gammaproteobacteria bacterium]